jgi:integrase
MAGQIIKRGKNKWLVRLQSRRSDKTRKSFSETLYGSRADAEKLLQKFLREATAGKLDRTPYTLNEWLDEWLADARRRVREKTAYWYEFILREYVRPTLGHRRLTSIKALDAQQLFRELQSRQPALSSKTLKHIRNTLSSALREAVKFSLMDENPCQLVTLPKAKRGTITVFTPAQAQAFLAACRASPRYGAVLSFALTTGLRPSEYLALRWSDLELPAAGNGLCRVQRSVTERKGAGGGWAFDDTKTARGRRAVTFPPTIVAWLQSHRRAQLAGRLRLGIGYEDLDLVFANRVGHPQSQKDLTRYGLVKTLAAAALPKMRLYDLRHSHATLLLAEGENPKIVSERLGHASIAITLDTYSHVLPDMQKATAEKLETMLFG